MKYLLAPLILFVFAAPAQAGEIIRPDTSSDFQWESRECPKPIPKPDMPGMTKQDRLMAYARDIEVHIDCLKREAQRDFDKAQTKMQDDLQRDLQCRVDTMNDMMLQAAKTMR